MKKHYLATLACLFSTGFVFAQIPVEPNNAKAGIATLPGNDIHTTASIRTSESYPDTVYVEDFGGGSASSSWLPAGWTNTGVSHANALWEYRGLLTTPSNSTGSRGACMNAATVLNSPTVSNGFFIFDSNYLDDQGSTCAGGIGSGPAPAPHKSNLRSDIISTVGYPSVMLVFNYYIRDFSGEQRAEISTNGGGTWTSVWEAGLQANGQSALSAKAEVLLPAAAGNNPNFMIRFVYDGNYYAWMLDDIMIVVPNANDLKSTATEFLIDDFWSYLLFTGGDSSTTQPTMIHLNAFDSVVGFGFYQDYQNLGSATQTNVKTNVEVSLNSAVIYAGSSTGISAPVFSSGLLGLTDTWKPTQKGKHIFTYTITQSETDVNLLNNIGRDSIVITDSVYAREWYPVTSGLVTSGLDDEGSPDFANQGSEYFSIANLVDLPSGDTVTSITFRIDPAETRVGALLSVNILDYQQNPWFSSFPDGVEYTVKSQDLTNGWITVPFYSVPLNERILPASRYYAVVSIVDNTTGVKDLSIRYYNNMPYGTMIKRPSATPMWAFYTGVCAVIRLNFAHFYPFSTEDQMDETFMLSNYPNPAQQSTTIVYSLNENAEATLTISDLSGKQVLFRQLGQAHSGLNQVTVDLSTLSNGVYLYTINAGGIKATRKLIVEK